MTQKEDKRIYEKAIWDARNRLAALKTNGVTADTVTIPVAKLSDWEMYCAMVDENEMQGAVTTAVAMENIGKGCDLIEKAPEEGRERRNVARL